MKNKKLQFLSNLFPFRGLRDKTLETIFSEFDYSITEFSRGDVIYSPENYQRKIGFVLDGECEVMRIRSDGDPVFLNTLSRYGSFGILSFLSQDAEYPTQIKALRASSVLFISGDDMLAIIKKYPTVAMNVIAFLAERVSFLNKKMATFSEKSTSQKLASYLMRKFGESGSEFSVSRTRISAEINIGRASLYRDLDTFEKENLIKVNQKKIIIISPEGLERKIK